VRIRVATADETDELTNLALESKRSWGYDEEFMARCRAELTVRAEDVLEGRVFVAADAGAVIIGMYLLRDLDGSRAELDMLFVAPGKIDQGVGSALMADAIDRARGRGRATMRIESDPFAGPFYEHEGAVLVGWEHSRSTGRELPIYEISLSP